MTIGEREKLRAERKLRIVDDREGGSGVEFVPAGVYGFTYSPATEGVPLFQNQTYQIFEIHKLSDETVHFVGFMTEADADALNSATETVELKLYPEPYETAQRFVSVAKDRMFHTKPASREKGNFVMMTVAPR